MPVKKERTLTAQEVVMPFIKWTIIFISRAAPVWELVAPIAIGPERSGEREGDRGNVQPLLSRESERDGDRR